MSKSENSTNSAAYVPGTPKQATRLARLTERERDVYVSVEQEGLRPADLARYTDMDASTIRTYLSRARQKVGESE